MAEEYDDEDLMDLASNPSLADGLKNDVQSQQNTTGIEDNKPNSEDLLNAESTEKENRKVNKASFLDRGRILAVIFFLLIAFILVSQFLTSSSSDSEDIDLLNKRGKVYIPDAITNWKPIKQIKDSFASKEEPGKEYTDDIDEILAKIPYSDEARQENTSPVTPTSSGKSGVRIETHRNEQQKTVQRMAITDNELGSSSLNRINNRDMNSQSYGQYASQRMNNLVKTASPGAGLSGNSYADQSNKQAFGNTNMGAVEYQWNSEYTLDYGTVIDAALITGINTDLPGMVIARVTNNVYSSRNGKHLLIPVGTRIFATYNSSISYGQNRIQIAWNKLIRPDGLEVDLGNFIGVDKKGYAGYRGLVNNHPFELLKAFGLIAAFSLVTTKVDNISETQNNLYAQNVTADVYAETAKLGSKIVNRALDIQPTITISQGKEVKIITNVTMDFPPVESFPVTQKYIRKKR